MKNDRMNEKKPTLTYPEGNQLQRTREGARLKKCEPFF